MATANTLLSLLHKVRRTAHGEWVACCPAHEDRSPSLAIKETPEGRVLVHCFAGCPTEEVLNAVGLTFGDLMPERVGSVEGLKRLPWNPRTVLAAVVNNATLLAIMAGDVSRGRELSITDKDKMFALAGEIQEAMRYATH